MSEVKQFFENLKQFQKDVELRGRELCQITRTFEQNLHCYEQNVSKLKNFNKSLCKTQSDLKSLTEVLSKPIAQAKLNESKESKESSSLKRKANESEKGGNGNGGTKTKRRKRTASKKRNKTKTRKKAKKRRQSKKKRNPYC